MKSSELLPLIPRENWDGFNLQIKTKYFSSLKGTLRCYHGLAHALQELVMGTNQFLNHKKNVVIFEGMTPYFEILNSFYIRENIQITKFKYHEMPRTEEAAKAFVEALPKETLYTLFCEDHIATAEIYPWEALDRALNAKRIFSIRVSHFTQHFRTHLDLGSFSIQIGMWGPARAIGLLGQRVKVPPLVAPYFDWSQKWGDDFSPQLENRDLVLEFEEFFPEQRFFDSQKRDRLFDRAILTFVDLNADILLSFFEEKKLMGAESLSLCSWNAFQLIGNWWNIEHSRFSPEEIKRGTILIPIKILLHKNVASALKKYYEERVGEQSWLVTP